MKHNVQQEPFLFTASIDHNVAYGDPWAGRPNIERSAQMAQLPRETLLATVSTHRESHTQAHEALASLGKVIEKVPCHP